MIVYCSAHCFVSEKGTCVPWASSQILYFTNGHLYPTGSKADRASLLHNPPTGGVATLKLTDLRPSDTGTYLCNVNNPPDFYTNGLGIINLTVLGKACRGCARHPPTLEVFSKLPNPTRSVLIGSPNMRVAAALGGLVSKCGKRGQGEPNMGMLSHIMFY